MFAKILSYLRYLNDWKYLIPITAAVVMFFAPESVDNIIKLTLKTFGFPVYEIIEDPSK